MESTSNNILVTIFFLHCTIGTALLAWWFTNKKSAVLKNFGLGLLGYALGLAAWSLVVLTKPDNLKPIILLGVVPYLLAHIAFAKAASAKLSAKDTTLMSLTLLLLVATFIARTFFFKSEPYFSDRGLLYFGLKSVPVALYIATISVSFLPAIKAMTAELKNKSLKTIMGVGFTVLYVNSIILVSAKDDTLLLINGVVLGAALFTMWVKALSTPKI